MKSIRRAFLSLLAAAWLAAPAPGFCASGQAELSPYGASAPSEVAIPNSRRIDFTSQINGHRYSLTVALPYSDPPPEGCSVLYVLDGNWFFATAADAVRLWNAPNVLVVGIGYPEDSQFIGEVVARRGEASLDRTTKPLMRAAVGTERTYDLTLPASQQVLDAEAKPWPAARQADVGGVDECLKVIETEVKPRIARLAHVNAADQVLYGDSFGGLAALHALFVEPNAFRSFIIGSPSIWWANRTVLADEAAFAKKVEAGEAHPHVLITMGGDESRLPESYTSGDAAYRQARDENLRRARMVQNGAEVVAFLKTLHGSQDYEVENYTVFEGQHHGVSSWSALARGIVFAFPLRP